MNIQVSKELEKQNQEIELNKISDTIGAILYFEQIGIACCCSSGGPSQRFEGRIGW